MRSLKACDRLLVRVRGRAQARLVAGSLPNWTRLIARFPRNWDGFPACSTLPLKDPEAPDLSPGPSPNDIACVVGDGNRRASRGSPIGRRWSVRAGGASALPGYRCARMGSTKRRTHALVSARGSSSRGSGGSGFVSAASTSASSRASRTAWLTDPRAGGKVSPSKPGDRKVGGLRHFLGSGYDAAATVVAIVRRHAGLEGRRLDERGLRYSGVERFERAGTASPRTSCPRSSLRPCA